MYERTGKTRIVYSKDVFSMAKPDIINYITDLWPTQMYIRNIVINKQLHYFSNAGKNIKSITTWGLSWKLVNTIKVVLKESGSESPV